MNSGGRIAQHVWSFESAIKSYGLSSITRLRILLRVSPIMRKCASWICHLCPFVDIPCSSKYGTGHDEAHYDGHVSHTITRDLCPKRFLKCQALLDHSRGRHESWFNSYQSQERRRDMAHHGFISECAKAFTQLRELCWTFIILVEAIAWKETVTHIFPDKLFQYIINLPVKLMQMGGTFSCQHSLHNSTVISSVMLACFIANYL